MSNFGNSLNYDDNLLLSLPAGLQGYAGNEYHNESFMPLTSQNYSEKYKELERILSDEKKTNEEFKKFYKALKSDHTRVKNENVEIKTQITSLIEENKGMQEKYKAMLEKMQTELRRKQLFIEELKNRELDEIKLEKIKDELSQQIETPYKDIVRQLELELQKLQQELNKSRFETNFLKSVNEHDKTEHHNHVEQLKMKNEIELTAMRKDRDILRQKLQETNQVEINKVKDIIRENNQFKIKIKSLLEENDELREKLEHDESHNNALVRNHSKVLSDHTTKISILESEKESLRQQMDNYHKETANLNETIASQVRKLHDLERENTKIKLNLEEVQHKCKKDLANMKLELVKEKGEENRIRETLNNQIEDFKLKLEIENNNVLMYKKLLEEKERELAKQMNTINEENWAKITELTNDKIELESRVQLLTKDFEFKYGSIQLDKDKSDDKLKAFEKQREEIIRENNRLRALLVDTESLRSELEREQEKNRELYRKFHKTETELNTNSSLEQELTEINMRLKSELSFHIQEAQRSKEQIIRLKDEYENRFSDWKSQFIQEKNDLKFKSEDLQSKLTRANAKLGEVEKFHEKKKKQYQAFSRKLKMKSEALNYKLKDLKLKEKDEKQMVPVEAYSKLKIHLNAIHKRHQSFRDMILNGGNFNNAQQQLPQQTYSNQHSMSNYINYQTSVPVLNLDENDDFLNVSSKNLAKETDYYPSIESHSTDKIRHQMNNKFDEIANRLDQLTSIQNDHIRSGNISHRSLKRYEQPKSKIDDYKSIDIEPKKLSYSSSSSSFESLIKNLSDKEEFNKSAKNDEIKSIKTSIRSSSSSPEKLKPEPKQEMNKIEHKSPVAPKPAARKVELEKYSSYEDDFDDSAKQEQSEKSSSSSSES